MFTGLIEGIGKVITLRRTGGDAKLTVRPLFQMEDIRLGESIAVNGVCLSVTVVMASAFEADVSSETLLRSTLGQLKRDAPVNIERALRLSDRLGGHLVSGHVDGMGEIIARQTQDRSCLLRIRLDAALSRYTIEKGSIAVDGVSLTLNRCETGAIEVNIIPQTGKETTLLMKRVGDPVNIETDLIGKYVEKFFDSDGFNAIQKKPVSGLTRDKLMEEGFGK